MACPKGVCTIIFGIVIEFIGFVMTMYGFLHKPFYDEESASWCDFCEEERETTLRNTKNCRIAGPIFMVIGVIVLIYARSRYKKLGTEGVNHGIVMTTTAVPAAGGYPTNPATVSHYVPGGYRPQPGGYPPQAGVYPQQVGGYPLQAGGYPPQGVGYPPQAARYPIQAVAQAVGYPPQAGGYPQQAGGYAQQPGGYSPAQNYPPPTEGEGEPNAPPPYEASAPPPPQY